MSKLRQQFEQEQRLRAETTSKKPNLPRSTTNSGAPSINKQKGEEENKYRVDLAKVEQEEEFFARWLKQRENLGILDVPEASNNPAGGPALQRRKTTVKPPTQTKKELNQVNAEIKKEQRLAHLEFEKKEVR